MLHLVGEPQGRARIVGRDEPDAAAASVQRESEVRLIDGQVPSRGNRGLGWDWSLEQFYHHYRAVKPYLTVHDPVPEVEFKQTPEQRDKLDGLYECILCGCCTTSCPSFWWNPDKFRGPAALLQSYRFRMGD